MKKKILYLLFFTTVYVCAQNKNLFKAVYPIGDNPNVGYKTNMNSSNEKILFEASAILRMPFYNNIVKNFMDKNKTTGSTFYVGFNPTLRMYNDVSRPVKTPTYKVGLGFQNIIEIKRNIEDKIYFLSYMIESGHYSNGQGNSAFSSSILDGTPESQELYDQINSETNLSDILNRENGNFSTNFTEIAFSYRILNLDDYNEPISGTVYEFKWNRFHNNLFYIFDIGGYTEDDINIYGKNRFKIGVEKFHKLSNKAFMNKKGIFDRVSYSMQYEYIYEPHPSVNQSRIELTSILYFKNETGIFISGIYGHDNYNYRFVDSGFQLFLGLTFDIFPPFQMRN